MPANYPDANERVRNIAQLPGLVEILLEIGEFRVVRVLPPYYAGSEFWVVNDKGFFWEPATDVEAAKRYIESSQTEP